MLYPQSRTCQLDPELFKNPSADYRGAPFWSWNCKLDLAQLMRQIDDFHAMGMGGFHIHPRTGLATEYLGEEFMQAVKASLEKAKQLGMKCYLYDEDRWPSGFAGGLVTENRDFALRHLRWTCKPYGADIGDPSSYWPKRVEDGKLVGVFDIELTDGLLTRYTQISPEEAKNAKGTVWYAYLEREPDTPWYNNKTYVDTLNPAAIKRFLEVTHEKYFELIGDDFGTAVPSIFTDEPEFAIKFCFAGPEDRKDLTIPYTDDLPASFLATYGQHLDKGLPELFWELPGGKKSVLRYRYHDHICERFTVAFADQVGQWCEDHGILLTGHMMEESTLAKQTNVLSEAMRSYRGFQLPGIDMLCDWWELNTAKQAQSASRQYGREGVLSELYGVTNWDYDFAGHKRQGDWQAALGITLRVHHLNWVSMEGEAKRDYPASIGYQSPWFKEYPLVENHFARLNVALTRGKAKCRVCVIHPVESYWLAFGPQSQTSEEREELETRFTNLTEWLLHGLIDFDFVCESLLPSQLGAPGVKFNVGEMAYDVVVVPGLRTIRSTTLDALQAFTGEILFLGEPPSLVDAEVSADGLQFAVGRGNVGFSRAALLSALSPYREIDAVNKKGVRPEKLMHQIRKEGDRQYVFVCNTDRYHAASGVTLRIRGEWKPSSMDTITGTIEQAAATYEGGWTFIGHDFPAHGSLLLQLEPGRSTVPAAPPVQYEEVQRLHGPVPIRLSEPNVLVLDQCRYRINNGEWQGPEETLRIENIARKSVGLAKNDGYTYQPWVDLSIPPILATVELEFTIETRIRVENAQLAMEDRGSRAVEIDGHQILTEPTGYFVDECVQTYPLPVLEPGTHTLRVTTPLTRTTTFEWSYLLGDFGVVVAGRHAYLTEPVRELSFGDWTRQGLPFYAGNVTYLCDFEVAPGDYSLRVPRFKAPLLSCELDGGPSKKIAFAPFEAELGNLTGKHKLEITAYGSRINAFGQLHNVDPDLSWYGPDSWRSECDKYAYEYQLKPCGILTEPMLCKKV
jgi:hypothetical protein